MSLIKVTNSPYLYSTIDMGGKTYRKSTRTKNRHAAEMVDEAHRLELIEKLYSKDKKTIKLSKAIADFLTFRDEKMTGQYERMIAVLADKKIGEIKTTDLLLLVTDLRQDMGERTIKNYITKLKMVLSFSQKNGFKVNALDAPKLRIKRKQPDIMTTNEESRLLAILKPATPNRSAQDSWDFCVMLIDTGARLNEIAKLKWQDVDLNEETIFLRRSKVNNCSVLYLTKRAVDILKRREQTLKNEWVFNAKDGTYRKHANVKIRNALKAINAKYVIHDLRHIYASRMIAAGVPIYEVSKILGHSHTTMTENYAHLDAKTASKKTAKILDDLHERNEQVALQEYVNF